MIDNKLYSTISDFTKMDERVKEFNDAYYSDPEFKQIIKDSNFLIDMDYIKQSNALEKEETKFVIKDGFKKQEILSLGKLGVKMLNHATLTGEQIIFKVDMPAHATSLKRVIRKARDDRESKQPFDDTFLMDAHYDLLSGTKQDMIAGRYRGYGHNVRVLRANWSPPDGSQVYEELEHMKHLYATEWANDHPIVQAAKMHVTLVYIQPFFDGNKRMSRLLTNYVLLKNDIPIVTVKSKNRDEYIDAINTAIETGDVTPMVEIICTCLDQRLNQYRAFYNVAKHPDKVDESKLLKKPFSTIKIASANSGFTPADASFNIYQPNPKDLKKEILLSELKAKILRDSTFPNNILSSNPNPTLPAEDKSSQPSPTQFTGDKDRNPSHAQPAADKDKKTK